MTDVEATLKVFLELEKRKILQVENKNQEVMSLF
jgi:hypothetical protein